MAGVPLPPSAETTLLLSGVSAAESEARLPLAPAAPLGASRDAVRGRDAVLGVLLELNGAERTLENLPEEEEDETCPYQLECDAGLDACQVVSRPQRDDRNRKERHCPDGTEGTRGERVEAFGL